MKKNRTDSEQDVDEPRKSGSESHTAIGRNRVRGSNDGYMSDAPDVPDVAESVEKNRTGSKDHPIGPNVDNPEDYPVVDITVQIRGADGYTQLDVVGEEGSDPIDFGIDLATEIKEYLSENDRVANGPGMARNGAFTKYALPDVDAEQYLNDDE